MIIIIINLNKSQYNNKMTTKYKITDEKGHRNYILEKYKNNKIIIYIDYKLDHDGYDKYGPESNLHYLTIYYRIGYNLYRDRFCREYWYDNCGDIMKYEKY